MGNWPENRAAQVPRTAAAVGFWVVAVLFVADVSLLSGWLVVAPAGAQAAPAPAASATPTEAPSAPAAPPSAGPSTVTEGTATVAFPGPATRSEQVLSIAGAPTPLIQHSAEAGGAAYNLGVVEYPAEVDVSDPAVILLASVSGAAGTTGGQVIEQDLGLFRQRPSVEFVLDTETVRLTGRNVLVGRQLYQQSVAYPLGAAEPSEAQPFFESLRLPPP